MNFITRKLPYLLLTLLLFKLGCKSIENKNEIPTAIVNYDKVSEQPLSHNLEKITGIVRSSDYGKIWVQENTENDPYIYLYDVTTGKQLKKVFVRGTSLAWEDLAYSEEGGVNTIHIGDIGDQNKVRNNIQVYTFKENSVLDNFVAPSINVYQFPDKPKDVRAMMVHQKNKEYYFFTYSQKNTEIFKISMDKQEGTLERVGCVNLKLVESVDYSEKYNNIVFLSKMGVHLFNLNEKDNLSEIKNRKPKFEYHFENFDGKGVCFASDNSLYVVSKNVKETNPKVIVFNEEQFASKEI
ncbi:hypothetical protein KMW28_26065 [Flammeovirga yaeyamensis]|uniref:Lipoprotein n=1 Tax=Flammeovirga yaeyamensis TaxID=367791 RepID=A0AAX1N9X4_9BACT|nr:hypothetical protein [Flammeovirga yaeyamensis]MBB3699233.1 hypothetical protein [Flammeovirga yaeyamensis]NMF35504.1 hypothetical protein [Flammeovirga yaeyamensis]QWG04363.1 hypothetical protein KMW28_26065 [Flammeovirga yaeyamensis]